MNIKAVQQCRSIDGWQAVRVHSSSGEQSYTVFVNPWGDHTNNICECLGYQYRGQCRHQAVARDEVCGWRAVEGIIAQTQDEYENKECPKCGEETMWVMENVDDD